MIEKYGYILRIFYLKTKYQLYNHMDYREMFHTLQLLEPSCIIKLRQKSINQSTNKLIKTGLPIWCPNKRVSFL